MRARLAPWILGRDRAPLCTRRDGRAAWTAAVPLHKPSRSHARGRDHATGRAPHVRGCARLHYDHATGRAPHVAAPCRAWLQVSSYGVLDQLVAAASTLPRVELITLMGHSSGGQTVQRYAFSTSIVAGRTEPPAPRAHAAAAGGLPGPPRSALPRVRYVVANPSSFVYFDDRRWDYRYGAAARAVETGR